MSGEADLSHPDQHRAKLTPGRRRALDVLEAAGKPLGAYDMMELLGKDGRRPAPISVYRALDFLVEHGYVHRLASRNAFLACAHRHKAHDPVAFLICDNCGRVDEATSPRLATSLGEVAEKSGFIPRAEVIEIAGRCSQCAETPA
ncbi:MAG: Fur family transcriptional regulator, zinc uptake regulator [Methylobacteriaceae bacterium]|jgi:Fur family zinc uptake transcriptional regulator|nr:Fur family transcriptional regulator, zinc uptake regulator [Methylobacteriaceae bacterium]